MLKIRFLPFSVSAQRNNVRGQRLDNLEESRKVLFELGLYVVIEFCRKFAHFDNCRYMTKQYLRTRPCVHMQLWVSFLNVHTWISQYGRNITATNKITEGNKWKRPADVFPSLQAELGKTGWIVTNDDLSSTYTIGYR